MRSKVFGVYGKEKRKAAEGRWEKEERGWERERERKRQTKREREGDIEGEYIGTDEEDQTRLHITMQKFSVADFASSELVNRIRWLLSRWEKYYRRSVRASNIREKKKSRQTWTWCIMTVMMRLIYTRSLWTRWLLFAIAAELDAATLLLKVLPLKRLSLSLSLSPVSVRREARVSLLYYF